MHSSPYIITSSGDQRYFDRNPLEHYYDFGHSRGFDKYSRAGLVAKSMPTPVPIEPHEHDVLMGRGGRNNQHSGNNVLRQLARVEGENYRVASKKGKSAISRLLVRQMRELDPPARFLKRVQQTAAWEEVSEDTAREKASQVLRDAVAGLLEGKEEEADEPEAVSDTTPVRTVSAPVSLDEQDRASRAHAAVRSRPEDFQPPRSSRSESSASKRQRYSLQSTTFHSFDDHYSPQPQPVVGYSPIRRHSDESYAASAFADPPNRRLSTSSATASAVPHHHAPADRPHRHVPADRPQHRQVNSGNQFELELLHGELLESDVEDEPTVPPETSSRGF